MKLQVFAIGILLLNFGGIPQAWKTECGNEENTRLTTPAEKVPALAARIKLSMGELIKEPEKCFQHVLVAKADAPEDRVTNLAELKGKTLNRTIEANEILREDYIDMGWWRLPKEFRQVGIEVSARHASQKRQLVLSHVDVFWTVTRKGQPVSRLLLQKKLVLAVEDSAVNGKIVVALALLSEDVAKLELARGEGTIDLVIRKVPRLSLEGE